MKVVELVELGWLAIVASLLYSTLGETYHLNMARATAGSELLKERLAVLHLLEGAIRRPCRIRVLISLEFEDCDHRTTTC